MSKPDHNFKANTEIRFHLSLGIVGGDRSESFTLEELGISEGLESKTQREVEKDIDDCLQDWSSNFIDMGWGVVE